MNRSESVNQTYVRKAEKKYQTAQASLIDVVHRFGSEEICRDYLEKLRWEDGKPNCPRCESESVSRIATRQQFDCNVCRFRFSVTSGTIFDNTKLPLWKWFAAAYLMVESKKSMSANQIKRTLGITYKTSWHLCHRIREAMETVDQGPALFGIIELDETLLKTRKRNVEHIRDGFKRGGGGMGTADQRIWVAGALQRGGQVRLQRIKNLKRENIMAFVKSVAKSETEAFYTDELKSYIGLATPTTKHETVNHEREVWVKGANIHTNGIEGVWSLFKRSIVGAFHKISEKHLDAYLCELEYRYNNRDNTHAFRDLMARLLKGEALRYQSLTA